MCISFPPGLIYVDCMTEDTTILQQMPDLKGAELLTCAGHNTSGSSKHMTDRTNCRFNNVRVRAHGEIILLQMEGIVEIMEAIMAKVSKKMKLLVDIHDRDLQGRQQRCRFKVNNKSQASSHAGGRGRCCTH